MTVRIAFAGTGYINHVHARAARMLPDVVLTGVVNHKPDSMAKFAQEYAIAGQFSTVDELLKAGVADALVVSTPNYLHAPQSIAALQAGVHVMVEKPMAMNAVEAEQMIAASQKSGARLMVAHMWRFDPEVRWLRGQLDDAQIGQIIRTKSYGVHVNWGPAGWFTVAKYAGGGAMADMGIHALDTVRYLLGDPQPTSVYARIGTYYKDFDVDDTGVILVNWSNGVTSYIESGWWQPHVDGETAATQFYATQGFASLFPTSLRTVTLGEPGYPGESPPAEVHNIETGLPQRDSHYDQGMYERQMTYFIDCILQNRDPVPGGIEGWTNMRVVDAAYQSAKSGEVVKLS